MSLKFHFRAVYVLLPPNKGTIINAANQSLIKRFPRRRFTSATGTISGRAGIQDGGYNK